MALRLVRESSDTPNITNKDDVRMVRYAYGGYNGVVKAFGSECGYTADNGIFKVLDGKMVIDGWEIDIDGAGWQLNLSTITGTQYISIYAEINVATESVKLDSTYLQSTYPEIAKGDDLTETPNGTARLLLYNVKVEYGIITEVNRKFEIIPYANKSIKNLSKGLENGTVIPKNSQQVNNLEIKRDENGVLKIGDVIIPQRKLLYEYDYDYNNKKEIPSSEFLTILESDKDVRNRTFEITIEGYSNVIRFKIPDTDAAIYCEHLLKVGRGLEIIKIKGYQKNIEARIVYYGDDGDDVECVSKIYEIIE